MPLNIFCSHSLTRDDYKLFREVFHLCKNFGLEVTFIEGETAAEPVPAAAQQAIASAELLIAFLSRRGTSYSRVMEEIQFARRLHKKVLTIAERGLQGKEIQEGRNVIPFDARYPIDTLKRSVSLVRDLRLKREDGERVKGLVGMLVFGKVLAYFSG
jgi:hypothetical protein